MKRKVIIAGNWKMHKTAQEGCTFVKDLAPLVEEQEVYIAPSFMAIKPLVDLKTPIVIGAQNMHDAVEGAYTGEVSAQMLKDVGAQFVILGHSERRHVFGESDELINRKIKRALEEGIQPIFCIGETLEEREQGRTHEVLKRQIDTGLAGVNLDTLILAYEPVWAIGTGKTATPEIAEEAHEFCRQYVGDRPILYGGSVKPDNAEALLAQPNIDGFLVGGASLSVETFSKIIEVNKKVIR